MKPKSKPLFLFYLLIAYVLLQFSWWTYLMVQLNNENYNVHSQINNLLHNSPATNLAGSAELTKKLNKRLLMIAGEGSVFLSLIFIGIWRVRNTFKKEQSLSLGQKNFLLSSAHELKSPIASIRLQLETILYRKPGEELVKKMINNAIQDVERLNSLSEKILLASRIQNSSFIIEKSTIDISSLFLSVITKQRAISSNNIISTIEEGIMLRGDALALESVLINLIENAEKYSPKGSEINIVLKDVGLAVLFSISDYGCGIEDKDKSAVFSMFYRAGNEETRNTKGTGLGLFIVRYLINQHHAKITIKDNDPRGTIFEILFEKL